MKQKFAFIVMIAVFLNCHTLIFAETIILKSGKTIQGRVIEKTDKYIKIDFEGVSLTYWIDEIESVDGEAVNSHLLEKEAISEKQMPSAITKKEDGSTSDTTFLYQKKGIEYASEGKFKEAEKEFHNALEINKYYSSSQKSLKIINDLRNSVITEEYAIHYFKGLNYLINKQYQQAILEFQNSIKVKPDYANAYVGISSAYFALGQVSQAENFLQKAIQIDTNLTDAYAALGFICESLGKSSEAENYFREALQINPNFAEAYLGLGFAYHSLNQSETAIKCLQKSIQIDPNLAEAYIKLGIIYNFEGRYKEGREKIQRAKQLYLSRGDYQNAQMVEESLGRLPR